MFSRKKKYDLSNTDRDSSSSSSSSNGHHGNDHTGRNGFNNHTSNNTGSYSTSGDTLSRKKEQRRSQMFGTSSDVMSNRSSNSSLNRMSNIPLHEPMASDSGTKSRVYPIFEQGTPLPRTVSNPCDHSKVDSASNGSAGQKINATRMISDSKVDYKTDNRFDGAQISQQSLGLQHQSDGLETGPNKNQREPGPTNIDDVISSFQELNFKPADTTSLNTSLDLSISSDNDINANSNNNNNNNNNNNANIFTNSKQISNTTSNIGNNIDNNNIIQEFTSPQNKSNSSSFSLTNGQEEIKSLRQLRKAKPTTKVIKNIDFSKPSTTTSPIIQDTTTTISATTISASEPMINSAADKFAFQTPSTNDSISATASNMLSFPLHSSFEHQTNFKLSSELRQHVEKQEIENIKTDTANNSFPSEAFDKKLTINASSDIADMMIDTSNITTNNNNNNNSNNNNNNNMITNIDDECQKETSNEVHENDHVDKSTSKTDTDNTKEQSKATHSEEDNTINSPPNLGGGSTIGSIIYLQNNGVSRILIRNDTIAITRGDNVMQEISSSNRNFTTTDNLIEREQSLKEFELINSKVITNDEVECDPNRRQTMKRDDDYVNDNTDDINSHTSENTEEHNMKSMSDAINDIHSQPNTPQGDDTQLNDKSINFEQESTSQLKLSAPKKQPTTPTVGKFKLNAGSLNFRTKKESHRYKDGTNGKSGDDDDDDGGGGDDNDEHEYFKRRRQETIEGRDGSFRGIKNIVRSGVSVFANNEEARSIKTIMEQSRGKIIFFTTSMSVIRSTRDRCSAMKKILQNHRIYFEERDVYISEENAKDLIKRFRLEKQKLQADGKVTKNDKCGIANHLSNGDPDKVEYEEMLMLLPRLFVEDFDLGSYDEVFKLNETEVLKKIFSEFPKVEGDMTCAGCGGFRYTPCHSCHGSKRSRSNAFTEEFFSLRCTKCDENGLARCKTCNADLTSIE